MNIDTKTINELIELNDLIKEKCNIISDLEENLTITRRKISETREFLNELYLKKQALFSCLAIHCPILCKKDGEIFLINYTNHFGEEFLLIDKAQIIEL